MKQRKNYVIHNNNNNLTSFTLAQETNGDSDTNYEIENVTGQDIQAEDLDIVKEIAIDLFSFGKTREFDSIRGNTLYIEVVSTL